MLPEELAAKLDRLNENLERLNREAFPAMSGLKSEVKNLSAQMKYIRALTLQIKILNSIMLQTSKAAGISGMVGNLFASLSRMVDRGR